MKLTNVGSKRVYHDLLMEDFPPNQLGRFSDSEMIEAWQSWRGETIPASWIEKDESE